MDKNQKYLHTIYRKPTSKELNDVNNYNLSSDELLKGLRYTIIGRGILDSKNKELIINSILELIKLFPNNKEYSDALQKARDMKSRFIKENTEDKKDLDKSVLKFLTKYKDGIIPDTDVHNLAKELGVDTDKVESVFYKFAAMYANSSNEIRGGRGDNKTIEDIANKFDVPVEDIQKQVEMGEKVESEHTDDPNKPTEIAMDHLTEFPDYYDRLDKMEKEASRVWDKGSVNETTKKTIKNILRRELGIK